MENRSVSIIFKIYGAYSWYHNDEGQTKKNKNTTTALNNLIFQLERRIKTNFKESAIKIWYNRLRAKAGSYVLDGITNRIKTSNAIIFDITEFKPNVMFELGVAIEASRMPGSAKVYIICEGKNFESLKIPSDLSGYFITLYEIKSKKAVFHDQNSLVMSLISDITEYCKLAYIEQENDIK